MRRWLAWLFVLGLVGAACDGGDDISILEQVRYPDDEGQVTLVTVEDVARLELDGRNEHVVSDQVESFTARGHQAFALRQLEGRYVHIGIEGEGEEARVIWISVIGIVAQETGAVLYTGVFERLDEEGNAIFEDGTVLALPSGIEAPPENSEARALIDASAHVVRELVAQ